MPIIEWRNSFILCEIGETENWGDQCNFGGTSFALVIAQEKEDIEIAV